MLIINYACIMFFYDPNEGQIQNLWITLSLCSGVWTIPLRVHHTLAAKRCV